MGYKDKKSSSRGSGLSGVFLTKPTTYPGRTYFPGFNEQKFEPTTFKPVGPLAKSGTRFKAWRKSADKLDLGEWIETYEIFRGGTAQQISIVVSQRDETGAFRDPDRHPSPCHVLFEAYQRGKKIHKEWTALGDGSAGKRAALSPPQTAAVMQGILLEHRGKDFRRSPKYPTMLWLPKSAREAFEAQVELENPNFTGEPDNFRERYLHGDMLDLNTRKVIRVYADGTEEGATAKSEDEDVAWEAGGSDDDRKKRKSTSGYTVSIENMKGTRLPLTADGQIDTSVVRGQLFYPWDTVIRTLTDTEMLEFLCMAFADQPDLLVYAFQDRYELPDSLKRSIANRSRTAGADLDDREQRRPAADDDDDDERPSSKKPAADDDDDERPVAPKKPAADDDDERPSSKKPAADDDDDDERPSAKKPPQHEDVRGDEADEKPGSTPDDDGEDEPVNLGSPSSEDDDEEEASQKPPHDKHRPGSADFGKAAGAAVASGASSKLRDLAAKQRKKQ